jgi:hypothetical protein
MQVLNFQNTDGSMKRWLFKLALVLALATVFPAYFSSSTFAQGFGTRRTKVILYPKQAPRVFPTATNFAVKISTTTSIRTDHLRQIKESLEQSLPSFDRRFKLVAARPETIISCTISELTAFSQYETHYRAVQGTIGTHREVDAAGNSTTVPDTGTVLEPFTLTVLEGHLTAKYETKDAATGKILDADTLTVDFRDGYVLQAPSTNTLYQALIKNLVMLITSRFVIDFQNVAVSLPRGKLQQASELLQNGKWNSALEALEATPAFKKADDEAYRLYALGVAYEGLAYETPFLRPTKDYLEQAAIYYAQAKQKNSGEIEFQSSTTRVQDLLASYQKIESNVQAYETGERKKSVETALVSDIQKRYGSNEFVNNNTVISWVKSGAEEREIAKRLRNFKSRYFDLTPSGMSALNNSGVGAVVIDAMREAMRGKPYDGKTRRKWTELNDGNLLGFYPHLLIW